MRHIALLRAVNVGGRTVKMDRLRSLFEDLDFEGVRTYIQSGNVFFDAPRTKREVLEQRIAEQLASSLGFDVGVMVRTLAELEAVAATDHFAGVTVTEETRLLVAFLDGRPPKVQLPAGSPKGDVEVVGLGPREVYVVLHQQGRPVNAGPFLEKLLGSMSATTRFWHTTAKILEAAKSGSD